MSIVYEIVKAMNGSIDVKSKKDAGTTFTIKLDFTIDSNESIPSNNDIKHSDSSDADITGMNVLVVEDNELNMEIAMYILEAVSYTHLSVPIYTNHQDTHPLLYHDTIMDKYCMKPHPVVPNIHPF